MLVLFTDTDTDMTPQKAQKYGYHLISMPYQIDGKEVRPYEDFETFDCHAFYQLLRQGTLPQTCAISPEAYVNYFEPHFAAGNDILYVHFSRAMSGTFDAMKLALDTLKEKYPERNLFSIHPILHMGSDGMMQTLGKASGRINSLKKIIKLVEDNQEDIKSHRVCIGHTDCLPIVNMAIKLLKEKFGDDLPIEVVEVNPTAGSHCGPDGVGICFHAKHR